MHGKAAGLDSSRQIAQAPPPAQPPAFATAAAALAGVLGLLCGSTPTIGLPLRVAFPALFGLLLSLAIVSEFRRPAYRRPAYRRLALRREAIDAVSRRLSRRVYLVLYGLMGFELLLDWADRLADGRPFAPACVDAFQGYLACGVAVLVLIRVLAARRRNQEAEAAADPAMSE